MIKFKDICSLNNTTERVKIQVTGWKTMYRTHTLDIGPVSTLYKVFPQLNNKKAHHPMGMGQTHHRRGHVGKSEKVQTTLNHNHLRASLKVQILAA